MRELDEELWRLGVPAKTEHNEVAPAQRRARVRLFHGEHRRRSQPARHGVHEARGGSARHGVPACTKKPFAGVNGSGKHNNWSLSTDRGENLLNPGDTPEENAQFLLILTAVLQAVDEYQDLLCASPSRELPTTTVSAAAKRPRRSSPCSSATRSPAFSIPLRTARRMKIRRKGAVQVGVHVLPRFPKDTSDRNRTSPFAFTGNKFEFRMVGSSQSISEVNIILNTAVADVFAPLC